jgi:CheY-specific phosphatase CheX
MKPSIKNRIAIFTPQGFLDGNCAPYIISTQDRDYVLNQNVIAALVSLKKVIFFNKNGLLMLINVLTTIKEKLHANIGFCDYDDKKYKTILDMFKNEVNFNLYENMDSVNLLISQGQDFKDKKILLFNENSDQKNLQAIEMIERGSKPTISKDFAHFKSKKDDFDISIYRSHLGSYEKKIAAAIRGNIIIYTVRDFIDSDVASLFDLSYHNHSLMVGFKIFLFDATSVSSMNIHGINFFSKLATAGAEYGATFAIAAGENLKVTDKLKEDLEDAGILFYASLLDFFEDEDIQQEAFSGANFHANNEGKLTKKSIESLPLFIDSTIYTLEVMSGLKAKKGNVALRELDIKSEENFFASSIGFYGSLNGLLLLIMPTSLVSKSCAMLLGEEDSEEEDVLDALGELANIIGGKSRTLLSEINQRIDITLPRTFNSTESILENQQGKKGVLVDFDFDGSPFYFYLTSG